MRGREGDIAASATAPRSMVRATTTNAVTAILTISATDVDSQVAYIVIAKESYRATCSPTPTAIISSVANISAYVTPWQTLYALSTSGENLSAIPLDGSSADNDDTTASSSVPSLVIILMSAAAAPAEKEP